MKSTVTMTSHTRSGAAINTRLSCRPFRLVNAPTTLQDAPIWIGVRATNEILQSHHEAKLVSDVGNTSIHGPFRVPFRTTHCYVLSCIAFAIPTTCKTPGTEETPSSL